MQDFQHAAEVVIMVIVDYGIGNLKSIQNMLLRADVPCRISRDEADIADASKLLLPGMGNFDNCMIRFNASGLRPLVEKRVFEDKIPTIGICVGLQMMMEGSQEGKEPGLGWLKGLTVGFDRTRLSASHKVPNMGWLNVEASKKSYLWNDLEGSRFYFAHSYYVEPQDASVILLKASYGYQITVGIEKENLFGVQFHPEKSHRFGMQLLKNFSTIS